MTAEDNKNEEQPAADRNIWQELLAEASSQSENAQDVPHHLVVLGDKANGKSSVLNKFRHHSSNGDKASGYILDYSYIAVKNKYAMDKEAVLKRLNVWQLDDHHHIDVLNGLVTPSSLGSCTYVITLDFSRPHEVMEQVTHWLAALETLNTALMGQLDEAKQAELRLKISTAVQTFTDVSQRGVAAAVATEETKGEEENKEGGEEERKEEGSEDKGEKEEDTTEVDLTDSGASIDAAVPSKNLGVPVIFVGTKADFFSRDPKLSKAANVDDRFEFCVSQLRKAALEYGASVVLTSAAGEGVNVEVLQDLIYHNMYGITLEHPAKVVGSAEDFSILVPSGFDSLDLINSQAKNTDATFASMFPDANTAGEKKEAEEVVALTNEDFFSHLEAQLKGGPALKGGSKPRTPASPGQNSAKKKEAKKFFKSLLKK